MTELKPILIRIPLGYDIADVPVPSKGPREFRKAVYYLRDGEYDACSQELSKLFERFPRSWIIHYTYAVLMECRCDYQHAAREYREAERLSGRSGEFYCESGLKRIQGVTGPDVK